MGPGPEAGPGAAEAGAVPPVPPPSPRRVAVVGGGVTGLAAAYVLQAHGDAVTLLEADPARAGGHSFTCVRPPHRASPEAPPPPGQPPAPPPPWDRDPARPRPRTARSSSPDRHHVPEDLDREG